MGPAMLVGADMWAWMHFVLSESDCLFLRECCQQVGRLRAAALRRFGSAVLVQSARHEAALAMLCRGGVRGVACAVERRAAVQARSNCSSVPALSHVQGRLTGHCGGDLLHARG